MKTIIEYYKNRLEIDLKNLEHPISNMINLALSSNEFDQKILKQKLRTLGLALMNIKDHDESLYTFYLKKIVKNSDLSVTFILVSHIN